MSTQLYSISRPIKIFLLAIVIFSLQATGKDIFKMKNPKGVTITIGLALTAAEHRQGLSRIKSKDFQNFRGMLFVNPEIGPRRFWMPDTFFNLDIIFLDQNLVIVGIEKNVPAHPGYIEPPAIFITGTYSAQFVLETKAGAPFAAKLKLNDKLKFIGPNSLSEIALKTRQQL